MGNGNQNDDFITHRITFPNSCEEYVIIRLNLNHILEAQKLFQIQSFSDSEKKNFTSNAVIKFHFNYCLVIWTFSFRKFNKLINGIHKKVTKYSLYIVWWDMMIWEEHNFYNLVKVLVFTIKISLIPGN